MKILELEGISRVKILLETQQIWAGRGISKPEYRLIEIMKSEAK